jgi:hypothetical protein
VLQPGLGARQVSLLNTSAFFHLLIGSSGFYQVCSVRTVGNCHGNNGQSKEGSQSELHLDRNVVMKKFKEDKVQFEKRNDKVYNKKSERLLAMSRFLQRWGRKGEYLLYALQ